MASKSEILGINHSQAIYKLGRNIIWSFIQDKPCYRCGEKMTRETFSVDHKEQWQSSDTPLETFLDVENIDFSHQACNAAATSKVQTKHGTHAMHRKGCRCEECVEFHRAYRKSVYSTEKRQKHYASTGK